MKRPEPLLFGKYRLVERIAQSELARVYEAKSLGAEGFEKQLVVKLIRSELAGTTGFAERFEQHARCALSLSHANIVQLFDFGEIRGALFMAMEHVAGCDLATLLTRGGAAAEPLPWPLAIHVTAEVGRALDYAHRRRLGDPHGLGILHGRVCPSSILVSSEGEVKLSNFGLGLALRDLAGAGAAGELGKAEYMSPEQVRGLPVDGRSDLFSLAAVLYECLSGAPAFAGEDLSDSLERVRTCRYAPLDSLGLGVPVGLCRLVDEALRPRPEQRQDTVAQFLEELATRSGPERGRGGAARELGRYVAVSSPRLAGPQRAQHPLERPRPIRRDGTVLVVGPFESVRVPTELELALRAFGGRVVSGLDEDGWWPLVFEQAEADGQDAQAALRFLTRMRRAWSSARPSLAALRAGLRSGTVWLSESDPQQAPPWLDLVQQARELAREANPGSTRVSQELVARTKGAFEFRRDPMAGAWVLVGEDDSGSKLSARLVGREQSLRRFGDLLARALRSSPNRIVIDGAAGVGKSRLLAEAMVELRAAGHRVELHSVRLSPAGQGRPYSALLELLRVLSSVEPFDSEVMIAHKATRLAALGLSPTEQAALTQLLRPAEHGPPEPELRDLLGTALAKLLRSVDPGRLSLFAFDAAERIDAASLELLDRWPKREQLPKAVFLFLRTAGLPPATPVWPACHRLPLGPLDPEASRDLLDDTLGLREISGSVRTQILSKSAGNPLFIEQYARELSELGRMPSEVPARLRGTVVQQLRALSAGARRLIELVALIDAEPGATQLAELLGWPLSACSAALDELLAAALLVRVGADRYRPASQVAVDVVREELPRSVRHEVHLAIAQHMERRGSWMSAITQLEHALDAWPPSSTRHSLQLELYHRLGTLCVHARAHERGAVRMVAALDLADALGRDDMAARFCMLRSELLAQSGQLRESREWQDRAEEKLRASGSRASRRIG